MKQFTFDIEKIEITKDSSVLILRDNKTESLRTSLYKYFDIITSNTLKIILERNDIKITDKIIVSFDINHVNREASFVDKLYNLTTNIPLDYDPRRTDEEAIIEKIKYLLDCHYSIEDKKASV